MSAFFLVIVVFMRLFSAAHSRACAAFSALTVAARPFFGLVCLFKDKAEAGGVIIEAAPPCLVPCLPGFINTLFLKRKDVSLAFSSALIAAIILPVAAYGATPAGTVIPNTAQALYDTASLTGVVSLSNTVNITTESANPPKITLMRYTTSPDGSESMRVAITRYSKSANINGPYAGVPALTVTPAISFPNTVYAVEEVTFRLSAPIFIKLVARDANKNPAAVDTVTVKLTVSPGGDVEFLQLREIGRNLGTFNGYINTAAGAAKPGSGVLEAANDFVVTATFEGAVDADAVLVDPFGVVFDSATGARIDGAKISLIDASTDLPATVYGDDGISAFPSTITSGASATDGSGKVYNFLPGGYRFPFVIPGDYRLDIVPPAGFRAPSGKPTADLQLIPYAPYAILEDGSRGLAFIVNPGGALNVDIPIDPVVGKLYLTKGVSRAVAAAGDFLQYKLALENTSSDSYLGDVRIYDKLPFGFRYRKGSSRLNGEPASEPVISGDGRQLTFAYGDFAAGKKFEWSYVVEVAALARPGKAINTAVAGATGGVHSNTAKAEVTVREDLFASKVIIAGRVSSGACGAGTDGGAAGLRIYLEDGTYAVTDTEGKYHFEGVNPGTHVLQLDTTTIPDGYEAVLCEPEENDRSAGTPFARFVDAQGGTLWREDFRIAPKPAPKPVEIKGVVDLELRSSLLSGNDAGIAGVNNLGYTVSINVDTVSLKNMRLVVILPDEASYMNGTSTLEGVPVADPEVNENAITYRLGDAAAGWKGVITFGADIPDWGVNGRITTKAVILFDGMEEKNKRTATVDNALERGRLVKILKNDEITLPPHFDVLGDVLGDEDKKMLDGVVRSLKGLGIEKIVVVGHTDSTRIHARNRAKFKDNYALSLSRGRGIASYLTPALNLSPAQVKVVGKGPDAPVAGNGSEMERALNRRVGIHVTAHKNEIYYDLKNVKDVSGVERVEVTQMEMPLSDAVQAYAPPKAEKKTMPEITQEWLEKAGQGLAWVWPHEGFNPSYPSLVVAVKHDPSKKLRLFLDGEEAPPVAFEGVMKRPDEKVAVSFWRGVNIKEGDNFLDAVEFEGDMEVSRITLMVHYSGVPVKAELVPELSRLVADGKTPSRIAVRLTDRNGYPVREGIVGDFTVGPPYIAYQKKEELKNDPLTASKSDKVKFTVLEDGVAFIDLEPTSRTGEAVVRLSISSGEEEIKAWLTPEDREWILVGLAEGTSGYNAASGNMESLGESDAADKFYENGRLAFFAKGRIKGKWLLTVAYDSDRNRQREGTLHQTIDPDTYYTVYGDASGQGYDAASARALYVKIEKERFYAMFGDYDTGLTVTELSRYSRSLNGYKSEEKGEVLDWNVFVSDTKQAFVKDELRGDGTSGIYSLSRKKIVINSESIVIETRDRFKSEVVLSTQRLTRHLDYSIDYEEGTVFFRTPVYSRDEGLNPVYIVASYETFDSQTSEYNYGGRGAVRPFGERFEIGATHVHEGAEGGEADLMGADATVKLTDKTKLRAEAAATSAGRYGASYEGSAYLAELSHKSERIEGKAYLREQEPEFGMGQQRGSEAGMRKYGFDAVYRFDSPFTVQSEAFRHYNLSTDAVRDMARAELRYSKTDYDLGVGLRHAEDAFADGTVFNSEQVFAGASYRPFGADLVLRARREQSVAGNENADFPTRTTVGSDYRISEGASVFAEHEMAEGETEDSSTSRLGIKASPWSGAQVNTGLGQEARTDGTRVFSTTGLKQAVHLTQKWTIDAGVDRNSTLKHPGGTRVNTNAAQATGGADFTAVSAGAAFREKTWSWNGRVETRTSDEYDKVSALTGVNGELSEGLGAALGVQAFKSNYATGDSKLSADARLSLAYRPQRSAWIILDRFDYILDERRSASFDFDARKLVNNLNANHRMNPKTQLALQYGSKLVMETIDGAEYRGYTDLTGIEGRYDITKRWDVGLRASLLHSWAVGQMKYGSGFSVGHNLVKNFWLSLGYNLTGFRDSDFSKADYTAAGPYVKFRMKFDQESVRDAVKWFSGQ